MSENKQIQNGFNKGYMLMKYGPNLAQKLEKGLANDQSPFSIGLKAGIREASMEKTMFKSKAKAKARNYDVLKTKRNAIPKDKIKAKDIDLDKDRL
jgi:hypothetical protein